MLAGIYGFMALIAGIGLLFVLWIAFWFFAGRAFGGNVIAPAITKHRNTEETEHYALLDED